MSKSTTTKAKEKDSWAGIAPMLIANIEPDRAYKKIKVSLNKSKASSTDTPAAGVPHVDFRSSLAKQA